MADVVAGLITGARTLEYRTFADEAPGPSLVSVDISYCGICGTEVASWRTGHLHTPAVCGHEWVGVVAAVADDVTELAIGDRVVGAAPAACGTCAACRVGLPDHCQRVSLVVRGRDPLAAAHGGFARRVTVAAARLVPVLAALSDEEAAQVEPATVALHGVRRSGITPGDTVAVQGAGPIGLFAAQFARAAGAGQVIVIEPSELRRRVALELGASLAVEPAAAAEAIGDLTEGLGADVVIECAGVSQLLQTAASLARVGGMVSLLSFLAQPATIEAGTWLAKELRLVASNAYSRDDFRRSMSMLADGRVRAMPLLTRTIPLDELGAALDDLAAGGDDIKVLVDPRL